MLARWNWPKLRSVRHDSQRLLAPDAILQLAAEARLPASWAMYAVGDAILAGPTEILAIERRAPSVGNAVCLVSGGRITFRRVLAIKGRELRVRGDVAPFAEIWNGDVLGCVRPRTVDKLAAVDPSLFTSAGWQSSLASAHALAVRRKLTKAAPPIAFTTQELAQSDWPRVRAFWLATCGTELAVDAQPRQHVVGLFVGDRLVGANIQLVQGATSYSAYTLVDKAVRGGGGGRKMLDHAVRVARSQALESIYVHIHARNLPSIAAYRGAGFTKARWWSDESDPLASAERQWLVFELDLGDAPR